MTNFVVILKNDQGVETQRVEVSADGVQLEEVEEGESHWRFFEGAEDDDDTDSANATVAVFPFDHVLGVMRKPHY